jgi:hypothetical protein
MVPRHLVNPDELKLAQIVSMPEKALEIIAPYKERFDAANRVLYQAEGKK